jgi:hypothetical protein
VSPPGTVPGEEMNASTAAAFSSLWAVTSSTSVSAALRELDPAPSAG